MKAKWIFIDIWRFHIIADIHGKVKPKRYFTKYRYEGLVTYAFTLPRVQIILSIEIGGFNEQKVFRAEIS